MEESYRQTWHFLLNTDSFHKQWIYAMDLLKLEYWKKKKSDPITVYPFYGMQITFGQYPCARGVTFGDGAL